MLTVNKLPITSNDIDKEKRSPTLFVFSASSLGRPL